MGFLDPVSTTKEYLITKEEERIKSNSFIKCLKYDSTEDDDDEIIIKIDAKTEQPVEKGHDHDYNENQNTDISTSEISPESVQPETSGLSFKDKSELMDYITKHMTVDELFEKFTKTEKQAFKRKEFISKVVSNIPFTELIDEYFASDGKTKLTNEQSSILTNVLCEISTQMLTNNNLKYKVLNLLSKNHSDEFLEQALQENSVSSVCEKISMPNIISYLIHKVNVNENDENEILITKLNSAMIRRLICNTHNDKEIVKCPKEMHELLSLLFKNKPRIEVFDLVHDFLRNVLQNSKNQF